MTMTKRCYNFGAGPAMLPEPILRSAQEELLDWKQTGMSILEIGHRTSEFTALLNHAEQTLRTLLNIPTNYQVLFLGGAARTHFAMIPLNFLSPKEQAGYLVTGIWSKMALQEAQRLKKAYCLASTEENNYRTVPERDSWFVEENTSYVLYTPNETINGVRFPYLPQVGDVPLIADMTSCLLSEPIDVSRYALIFAGAQKNIANAGLVMVIVRSDLLLKTPEPVVPTMLDYKFQAEQRSLFATPPVFNCYLAAKMFEWVKDQGGVEAMYRLNREKSEMLYRYLDASDFYTTQVAPESRSLVNVCFSIADSNIERLFIQQAEKKGLCNLKGHRLVGGIRASLYNSMPIEGVEALIQFMDQFAKAHRQ